MWLYIIVSLVSGYLGTYVLDSYYKRELNRLATQALGDNTFLVGRNTLEYIGSMDILEDSELRKLISTISDFPSPVHEKYD